MFLTWLPRALTPVTIPEMPTNPISRALKTAASNPNRRKDVPGPATLSLDNRKIECSEAGSMQSPPEAFSPRANKQMSPLHFGHFCAYLFAPQALRSSYPIIETASEN
jgi:hypothetical protein